MIRDQSGRIKISLWEDQVDAVNNGDFVRVESAYTNEYNGVKALNLGKFGKIENRVEMTIRPIIGSELYR